MSETKPTETATEPEAAVEPKAARDRRNGVIAICLAAFVVLVFAVTLVRLQGDAANRWNYVAPTETGR